MKVCHICRLLISDDINIGWYSKWKYVYHIGSERVSGQPKRKCNISYRYWFLQTTCAQSHLSVDQLCMLENGDDVANDSNSEVHHNVFTEVHEHVLVNSAKLTQWQKTNEQNERNRSGIRNNTWSDSKCASNEKGRWFTDLPVVNERDGISDCQASWDPGIFKKLNPLWGGCRGTSEQKKMLYYRYVNNEY